METTEIVECGNKLSDAADRVLLYSDRPHIPKKHLAALWTAMREWNKATGKKGIQEEWQETLDN